MARGKQKIESQKKNAEKASAQKGSQLKAQVSLQQQEHNGGMAVWV
jgi:hypothetical protein